jgi:hypothetical protein
MTHLEDLQPAAALRGILPDQIVTVVSVRWFGSEALISVAGDDAGLLVRPDAARQQMNQEAATSGGVKSEFPTSPSPTTTSPMAAPSGGSAQARPKRYHGSVELDPTRHAGRIADEVITHLAGPVGSAVRVTLQIEADIPAGPPDNVMRTVTENSRTLTFTPNSGREDGVG